MRQAAQKLNENSETSHEAETPERAQKQIQIVTPSHLSGAQRVYMTAHSSCAMCETRLEIRHETSQMEFRIKEEAHCPSCGIRVRSAQHVLH